MKIPLSQFLAYLVGAGCVYVFFVMLDIISGSGFSWYFFFGYWDIMFMLVIFLHLLERK